MPTKIERSRQSHVHEYFLLFLFVNKNVKFRKSLSLHDNTCRYAKGRGIKAFNETCLLSTLIEIRKLNCKPSLPILSFKKYNFKLFRCYYVKLITVKSPVSRLIFAHSLRIFNYGTYPDTQDIPRSSATVRFLPPCGDSR